MIHTFELKLRTFYPTITLLEEVFEDEYMNALSLGQNLHITNPLNRPGIRKLNVSTTGTGIYYISFEVEPESLIRGKLSVDLFNCNKASVNMLENAINDTILNFDEQLPTLCQGWYLSRVDYARQIETPLTSLYVDLAKKAKIPYHYTDKVKKSGSMYLQSKSSRFNFYDKYDYIRKKGVSESLKEKYRDIYRVEFQYRTSRRINDLRKKYRAPSLFDLFDPDISIDIISNSYKKSIGTEDYYLLNEAKQIINKGPIQNKTKSNLISLLELIKDKKSYNESIHAISNNECTVPPAYQNNLNKFKRHVRKVKELGINPILLPSEYDFGSLSNPYIDLITI